MNSEKTGVTVTDWIMGVVFVVFTFHRIEMYEDIQENRRTTVSMEGFDSAPLFLVPNSIVVLRALGQLMEIEITLTSP